jgi:serine protease Do
VIATIAAAILLLFPAGLEAGSEQSTTPAPSWTRKPVQEPEPESRNETAGYLGVRLGDIDAERAKALKLPEEGGVEIKAVQEGSPSDKAGIQPGDVLLTYSGEPLLGSQQLARLVRETPPGRHVKVQYWRAGKKESTVIVVGTGGPAGMNAVPGWPRPDWPPPVIDFPSPLLVWRNSAVGIEFERVDSQLAAFFGVKSGVLVRSVQHGSPGEKAGLKAGDVIFSVAEQPLTSEHDFSALLRQRGAAVPLSVMRDHKRLDLTINLQ